MRVFISGQVTGLEKSVYEKNFNDAEEYLKSLGHEVSNPIRVCSHLNPNLHTWEHYMLASIEELFKCDAIFLLNGWRESTGARIENAICTEKSIKVFMQECNETKYRDITLFKQ